MTDGAGDRSETSTNDPTGESGHSAGSDAVKGEPSTATENASSSGTPIREELVHTATQFLQNPRVASSPLSQKRAFLLKKGLTQDEIDAAIDRVANGSANTQIPNAHTPNQHVIQMPPPHGMGLPPPPLIIQPRQSWIARTANTLSNVAVFSGLVYAAYIFYKRYIEPWLFGFERPKSRIVQIQEELIVLNESVKNLQASLMTIEQNLKRQIQDEIEAIRPPQDVSLHELKSEMSSIKALLLNRKQFPATPVPSIPSWQMNNKETTNGSSQTSESPPPKESSKVIEINGDSKVKELDEENHNGTPATANGAA